MRKLLLSVVALFAMSAQNAFAINLTFQFDVNSSGPSIYACNAGIKHGAPTKNLCYDRNTGDSCSAGCAAGIVDQCKPKAIPSACVCTGETNGTQGTYRLDFLQANTAVWTDNQVVASTIGTPYLLQAKPDMFNQIFSDNSTSESSFPVNKAYANQLKDLTINLGSELYGAEYFVDVCYRGPQIDYSHNGKTPPTLQFGLKSKATVFDIRTVAAGQGYKDLSNLYVKAEIQCMMSDEFDYCYADSLPGNENCNSSFKYNYKKESSWTKMNGSAISAAELISDADMYAMISTGSGKNTTSVKNVTPRFCQIRYSFSEGDPSKKDVLNMRKWKLQQARICTYSEISEPGSN